MVRKTNKRHPSTVERVSISKLPDCPPIDWCTVEATAKHSIRTTARHEIELAFRRWRATIRARELKLTSKPIHDHVAEIFNAWTAAARTLDAIEREHPLKPIGFLLRDELESIQKSATIDLAEHGRSARVIARLAELCLNKFEANDKSANHRESSGTLEFCIAVDRAVRTDTTETLPRGACRSIARHFHGLLLASEKAYARDFEGTFKRAMRARAV